MSEFLRFKQFSSGDDVMSIEEFLEITGPFDGCWGTICPGDGTGYWADDQGYSQNHPVFARGAFTEQPEWATKVVWFNK